MSHKDDERDSSGASGLSTATVLEQLMKRVQAEEGLSDTPLVEEYFDIVAGAGTGAITMTLTGRLGMTTEKAMECFVKLSNEVFSDKKAFGTPPFKASNMEKALKDIVRSKTGNENELMMDRRAKSKRCSTCYSIQSMVFAMSRYSPSGSIPTIFRSYHTDKNEGPNCTIWQALRAATAHPDMFKSMEIKEQGISQPYVDAAMGCGNPIEHVLKEARRLYPNRRVACIVSIGGGHPYTIPVPEPDIFGRMVPAKVIGAMQAIASDNERMAETMAERFQEAPNVYFRLNVDQGMQSMRLGDWDRLGEVKAHTDAYMRKVEPGKLMERAAKAIKERRGAVPVEYIVGRVHTETKLQLAGIKECPAPTSVYTERHKPIQKAVECLTSSVRDRRVFVFHGLGGAGKTQLALQTVERTREHWSDVVYVDATSAETLKSTLKGFAVARRIGETHEDTIRWLEAYTEQWLLVFDNADDYSFDLRQYLPRGARGRVLITTRNRDVALLAQGPESECNVSSMELKEALRLLLAVARTNEEILSYEESDAAIALVQDLGCLALGVVQAGAYIWRTCCKFAQYRNIYASKPKEILEKNSKLPMEISGYERTVYGTWMMSYQLLSQRAQRMLWLLAYLQQDRITQEVFRRAAIRVKGYNPALPLSESDERALIDVKEYLSSFLTNDTWDFDTFLTVMTEILSYSLISYDRVNETYVLHVLVQDWIHTVIPHSSQQAIAQSSFLLVASIDREKEAADYTYRRTLELHVTNVLRHCTKANQHSTLEFGFVMHENAHYEQAKILQTHALEARARFLGDEAKETLEARSDLAITYNHLGLYNQAEILQEQILESRKQMLGTDHLDTLTIMIELADTYFQRGRRKQAEVLEVQVLRGRMRLLGSIHPDTLSAMNNLAITYHYQGLHSQAETLQLQVLEARKRLYGDEHPETLTAMGNLATTYSKQGLHSQAETLEVHVLEARKQLYGDEHPKTLNAMGSLAATYFEQGLNSQAETLQLQVLEARKRLYGDKHPETLATMSDLAITYSKQGLHSQTETLQVQVLEARKQLYGDEHPETLSAMGNLANTYSKQGLNSQAETLQVQVLEARKQLYGDKHPETLTATSNLAATYYNQGFYKQAETLQVQVLEARKRLYGDSHPQTLTAMSNLAATYYKQGSYKQAEPLQLNAVGGAKRTLGIHHPTTLLYMQWLSNTYKHLGPSLQQQHTVLKAEIAEIKSYRSSK